MSGKQDWGGEYFNPRSHKGSDTLRAGNVTIIPYFNPRSHKGSDYSQPSLYAGFVISIHAPTRGATDTCRKQMDSILFQSTLPQGDRQRRMDYYRIGKRFQSTLPQGERHS